MIDFEKDQQDAMKRTDNIQSLADQVEKLESLQKRLELQEDNIKFRTAFSCACNFLHDINFRHSIFFCL